MNSLDPSLSKYLSSSKQDIYDEYHGSRKKTKKRKLESTGLLIAGEDGDGAGADSWNPWTATERKMNGGSLVYGDDENEKDRMPGGRYATGIVYSRTMLTRFSLSGSRRTPHDIHLQTGSWVIKVERACYTTCRRRSNTCR
jgi:hypothetical protein